MPKPKPGKIPQKLRLQALERDHNHCIFPYCEVGNLEVHHVVWLSKNGTHDMDNLVTLCPAHHRLIHSHNYSPRFLRKFRAINNIIRQNEKRSYTYPRRITQVNDPDLKSALSLYQQYFPAGDNDSVDEIKRFMDEATISKAVADRLIELYDDQERLDPTDIPIDYLHIADETEIKKHIKSLRKLKDDYNEYLKYIRENVQETEENIWVHKKRGKISGFFFYEYHFESQLIYVDYFVSKNKTTTIEMIGKCLVNQIEKEYPECQGIIAEIENPNSDRIDNRKRARARAHLFGDRYGAMFLKGASYIQPKMDLTENSREIPMLLAYFPLRPIKSNTIGKRAFTRILDMLIDCIYGSSETTQDNYEDYLDYLGELKQRIIAGSRYPIRLTSLNKATVMD